MSLSYAAVVCGRSVERNPALGTPTERPIEQKKESIFTTCDEFLLVHFLSYVDWDDLIHCELLSKRFRQLCEQSAFLYKDFCQTKWGKSQQNLVQWSSCQWKQIYATRTSMQFHLQSRAFSSLFNNQMRIDNTNVLRSQAGGFIENCTLQMPFFPFYQVNYFECHFIKGSVGSIGVVDSACKEYGKGSENHIGWTGHSIGYHSNSGKIVWNDTKQKYGGVAEDYVEPSKATLIGCGYSPKTKQLFFTRDGEFVGFVNKLIPNGVQIAAAVTLHSLGDQAVLNVGRSPFRYDIEQHFIQHLQGLL